MSLLKKAVCFSHLHHICKYLSRDSVPREASVFQWKKSRTQKARLNAFRNKQPCKTTWALLEINPKSRANSQRGLATGGSSAWEFPAFGSNMGSILLVGCKCEHQSWFSSLDGFRYFAGTPVQFFTPEVQLLCFVKC